MSARLERVPAPRAERLNFANQLRGVAALLVAISHLIGVFWAMRVFVASATFSPVQAGAFPAAYGLISYRWFQFGPFGVALFFLISGMVIPFSLQHHTRWTFFLARFLRIYPTFILCTLCEMLLLYTASRYWHVPFAYNARTIIAECLLISNLTGYPVIDFVSWTLAIEVKFYLLIMLVAPAIRRGSLSVLFGIALAITAMEFLLRQHLAPAGSVPQSPFLKTVGGEAPYLVFMFIGVIFHFYHARGCGPRLFAGSLLAMTALFMICWWQGSQQAEYPIVPINYLYAIVLFGGLYAARRHIPDNKLVDFVAAISFPFYVIHAVLGFTIMKYLMLSLQMNYYFALGCAVTAITAVASLFHVTIEKWTVKMGRRLATQRR